MFARAAWAARGTGAGTSRRADAGESTPREWRRCLRWTGVVRKMRPGETPRTGTGTRTAARAACAVPALYGTQRTREVAGKAGCAREGRGGDVHGDGEHGRERPRLLRPSRRGTCLGHRAPSAPLCPASQQPPAPSRCRYSRVRRTLELSRPRSPPYPAFCQFLTTRG
ncbi:hypothetical protein FB451DRAFT_1258582, partial [Mycena latifolia]